MEDSEDAAARRAARKKEEHTTVYEKYMQWRRKEEGRDNLPTDLKDDHKGDKLRWSYWSGLPGEQILPFLRDQVFHFIRNLGA